MKRSITIGLAVLSALLAAACLYLLSVVREKDDQLAALAERQRAQSIARSEAPSVSRDPNAPSADASIRPVTESKVAANESKGDVVAESKLETGTRPPLEDAARKMFNAILQSKYSGLIKELQLTDAEADKLLKILADQQQIVSIDRDKLGGGKLELPKPDSSRKFDGDRQARDLLGDRKFQKYQEYREVTEGRNAVTQLNSNLRAAGKAPLSDEQWSKVYSGLVQDGGTLPPPNPSSFGISRDYDAALADWQKEFGERIKDRLQTVLTPEQLSVN